MNLETPYHYPGFPQKTSDGGRPGYRDRDLGKYGDVGRSDVTLVSWREDTRLKFFKRYIDHSVYSFKTGTWNFNNLGWIYVTYYDKSLMTKLTGVSRNYDERDILVNI